MDFNGTKQQRWSYKQQWQEKYKGIQQKILKYNIKDRNGVDFTKIQ